MGCLGVHFALTSEQLAGLTSQPDDKRRVEYLQEAIEDPWDEPFTQESDKAWDAIHRCLGEFPPDIPWFYPVDPEHGPYALPEEHGTYPLKLCVLGGKRLTDDESNYIIRLIEPQQVVDIAAALQPIDENGLRERYVKYCKDAYPEYGEEDFGYTWYWFEQVRDFFRRMAGNGRSVIFTASQ